MYEGRCPLLVEKVIAESDCKFSQIHRIVQRQGNIPYIYLIGGIGICREVRLESDTYFDMWQSFVKFAVNWCMPIIFISMCSKLINVWLHKI